MENPLPSTPRPKESRFSLNNVLLVMAFALFAYAAFSSLNIRKFFRPKAEPRVVAPRGNLADEEKSTIELFREASNSVVHIITTGVARRGPFMQPLEIQQGMGSGFVWDDQGHIVTNYHVVREATGVYVVFAGQKRPYRASVVGVDPAHDLAVLEVSAGDADLRALPIGSSQDLQVGQKVFAIGNPFGLDQTLTTGVISGLDREIAAGAGPEGVVKIQGVIQTDAAINPGNSGGPLLDSAGRLIGINTAIASTTGAYAGIGFAVPVDMVNEIVPDLVQFGKRASPGLGISVASPAMSQRLRLPGVLVLGVAENGAGHKAGIRPTTREGADILLGDVIVAFDDTPIRTPQDLQRALSHHKVGDEITLTVDREGQMIPLKVRLDRA